MHSLFQAGEREHIGDQLGERQPAGPRRMPEPGATAGPARMPAGLAAEDVATLALAAVRDNRLYVMTHREYRDNEVEERFSAIRGSFDYVSGPLVYTAGCLGGYRRLNTIRQSRPFPSDNPHRAGG